MIAEFAKLSPVEKKKLAEELMAEAAAAMEKKDKPSWYDGKKIDEVAYCEELLAKHEMRCINNRLYTMDGLVEDQTMQAQIAGDLKPYIRSYLDKAVERILKTLKLLCVSDPIKPTTDRIHFKNGTYHLKNGFVPEREWTLNRLPVEYDADAPQPTRWLQFLSELMYEEDVVTLQEFLGYSLIATNKGQSMLLIIGSGGEGKSRISAIMQEVFGTNMNIGNIQKLEADRFALANQEGKLLFIDDDMKLEALASTNTIKAIVTCDGMMDLERKNRQSYQGLMYVRLIGLGNGNLKSLHDKTQGFYRRQIIIQTKDKSPDRVDDPFLKEKLEAEIPGIVRWCLDGLQRLIADNFKFTISERSRQLKRDLIDEDNNIIGFLTSTGYIEFDPNVHCTSAKLYEVYKKWCYENAERAVAISTFTKYLHKNAAALGISENKNIPLEARKYARGFNGINTITDGFIRIDEPDESCPF